MSGGWSRRVVAGLTSMKIAVGCFLMLALLTYLGTIYQVDHGIHAAEQRYFSSWICLHPLQLDGNQVLPVVIPAIGHAVVGVAEASGGEVYLPVPMPGAALVLLVLFVNMTASMILLLVLKVWRFGILALHGGVIVLIAGGAWIEWTEIEANLTLEEGQQGRVARMYHDWELSFWNPDAEAGGTRDIVAIQDDHLRPGDRVPVPQIGEDFAVEVEYFHANANYDLLPPGETNTTHRSRSNISALTRIDPEKQPERNQPGGMFLFHGSENADLPTLLFSLERNPTELRVGDQRWMVQLRRKGVPLPLELELVDFIKEDYANSMRAKSFASEVVVHSGEVSRDVRISMNKPLRYKGWTFYQKSFEQFPDGVEVSSFAVVFNRGRTIPYIGTFLTAFGLLWHFLQQLIRFSAQQARASRMDDGKGASS